MLKQKMVFIFLSLFLPVLALAEEDIWFQVQSHQIDYRYFYENEVTSRVVEAAHQKATVACVENLLGSKVDEVSTFGIQGQIEQIVLTNSAVHAKLKRLERLGLNPGVLISGIKYLDVQVRCTVEVAQTSAEKPEKNDSSLIYEDELTEVGQCIRKIIEDGVGGEKAVALALEYRKQVIATSHNAAQISKIRRSCSKRLKILNDDSKFGPRYVQELVDALNPQFTPEELEFLKRLAAPRSFCTHARIQAMTGFMLGFGFGLQFSRCVATNGRQWFEMGMGPGMGTVGGVAVSLSISQTERKHRINSPIEFDSASEMVIAPGIGPAVAGAPLFPISLGGGNGNLKFNWDNFNGVGFGFFGGVLYHGEIAITLLPWFDNPSAIDDFL